MTRVLQCPLGRSLRQHIHRPGRLLRFDPGDDSGIRDDVAHTKAWQTVKLGEAPQHEGPRRQFFWQDRDLFTIFGKGFVYDTPLSTSSCLAGEPPDFGGITRLPGRTIRITQQHGINGFCLSDRNLLKRWPVTVCPRCHDGTDLSAGASHGRCIFGKGRTDNQEMPDLQGLGKQMDQFRRSIADQKLVG